MNDIKEFMICVKSGDRYHFAFIKIDQDMSNREDKFYFDVIKNSFPSRESVNNMLMRYRADSAKTLYSADSIDELKDIYSKRPDILFAMIFENDWKYLTQKGE